MIDPPYIYRAEVLSVYDGDTLLLDIDLGFGVWLHNQTIRLFGLNAPELRGPERPQGIAAREALKQKLPVGSVVQIQTEKDKKGKYGRWLGTIWVPHVETETENINAWMVTHGYAQITKY